MSNRIRKIILSFTVFILVMSFISVNIWKNNNQVAFSKTSDSCVVSAAELKSILNSKEVSLTDDTPASIWWTPKVKNTVLKEVTAWLQEAKLYKVKIPKGQSTGMINGNIQPSKLYITTAYKHIITIQPAFYIASNNKKAFEIGYVTDTLQLVKDKQKSYFRSSQLFNWLRNNKWKMEFEIKK